MTFQDLFADHRVISQALLAEDCFRFASSRSLSFSWCCLPASTRSTSWSRSTFPSSPIAPTAITPIINTALIDALHLSLLWLGPNSGSQTGWPPYNFFIHGFPIRALPVPTALFRRSAVSRCVPHKSGLHVESIAFTRRPTRLRNFGRDQPTCRAARLAGAIAAGSLRSGQSGGVPSNLVWRPISRLSAYPSLSPPPSTRSNASGCSLIGSSMRIDFFPASSSSMRWPTSSARQPVASSEGPSLLLAKPRR